MSRIPSSDDTAPDADDLTLDEVEEAPEDAHENLSARGNPPPQSAFQVPEGHVLVPKATLDALMAQAFAGQASGGDEVAPRSQRGRKGGEPILLQPLKKFTLGDINIVVSPDSQPIEWLPNDHVKIDAKRYDETRSFRLAFDLQNPYSERYNPGLAPNFRVLNPEVANRLLCPLRREAIPNAFLTDGEPEPPRVFDPRILAGSSFESRHIADFHPPVAAPPPPMSPPAAASFGGPGAPGSPERRSRMLQAAQRTHVGPVKSKDFQENSTRGQTMLATPETVADFPVRRATSPSAPVAGVEPYGPGPGNTARGPLTGRRFHTP
jgi:hypothetical protein